MKVLVTGCTGAIGSVLADQLIEQGHTVVGIDNFSSDNKNPVPNKVEFRQCDIRTIDPLLFEGVEVVFHLAALTKLVPSFSRPLEYHDVNVNGTLNILRLAKTAGVRRVVFASSSAVYGHRETMVESETLLPMPANPYGTTKLIGEEYMKMYERSFELDTVSLRYFNVFAAKENPESELACVVTKFLHQKAKGKPMTITGGGNQRFSFVHVNDAVAATITAGTSRRKMCGETINIGGHGNISINEVAKMIGGPTKYIDARMGDTRETNADIHKAFGYLGWEPTITLEEYLHV